MIYRNGFYYLFFSGDGFTDNNYHVIVARSKSPTGPFERFQGNYFLHLDQVCQQKNGVVSNNNFNNVNSNSKDRFDAGLNCTFVAPGGGTVIQVV